MWARLDEKNQIIEVRDIRPTVMNVRSTDENGQEVLRRTGDEKGPTRFDIPHKGVRWREVVYTDPPVVPKTLGTVSSRLEYRRDSLQVFQVWEVTERPLIDVKHRVIKTIRIYYRIKLLDALGNDDEVKRLVAERDEAYQRVMDSTGPNEAYSYRKELEDDAEG